MRVAIEARALASRGSGGRSYAQNLIDCLRQQGLGDQLHVLAKGPQSTALLPWWLNYTVPKWLAGLKPELVHFTKAAVPLRKKFPTVVTIYDIIPILLPQSQRLWARLWWPTTLKRAAQTSDHIITISQASKHDIVERFTIDPGTITVTPLAIDRRQWQPASAEQIASVTKKHHLQKPYLITVNTVEPRKNLPALIRAFSQIAGNVEHTLVIVGGAYKGSSAVGREVSRLGLGDRVVQLGFVEGSDLPALYSGAAVGVWPSVYEGWGFPAQEAMACGTPVVVSDGGSLPEVVGQAGQVVPFSAVNLTERLHDQDFEQRLSVAMQETLLDDERAGEGRELRLAQARVHSWGEIARQTLAVYKKIADV